jgi:hypothetical protein
MSDVAVATRRAGTPFPLTGIHVGGRDGIQLTDNDPSSPAATEELFMAAQSNKGAFGHAIGFVERIRYTPPELCQEFHWRALNHWNELRQDRHNTQRTFGDHRAEPAPEADINTWKKWLKDIWSQCQLGGRPFTYIGIPLIGQGYPITHIEGTRAILSFLPLTVKGTTPCGGALREAFLQAAAALLAVHG